MGDEQQEYEFRKKAIFDGMSKRGQERILRIGYENWEPFQEPKDPRERIFGSASLRATALLREFYTSQGIEEGSVALQKEMFEFSRGLLQGERRSTLLYKFCEWLRNKGDETLPVS